MSSSRFLTLEELVNDVLNESSGGEDGDLSDVSDISNISDDELEDQESSSDDDETHNASSDPSYIAKDGTSWQREPCSTGRLGTENIINMRPGVTRFASSRVCNIRDSFLLYFSPQVTKIIIENTNNYGKHLNGVNHIDVDEESLYAYLAVLLLGGVYKSKNETLHDMFDEYYGRPIFRSIMSERSFLNIHKIIRFDNVLARRAQKSSDKFAPIRNLWDKWSESLSQFYNPNDCVTVDEQLLGFHGRCKFRQYIPSKPERYGLKFWLLVDSRSCYVWKIQPYLGKDVSGVPERNQGEPVVLDLVDGLKGHNVTMDNFFSSHSLGQKLLQRNLTMVGTMRKNKRSIPPKLLVCKKVPRYESSFAFTPNTTLVSYISHKDKCTIAMSTMHHDQKVLNGPKKLPEIISFYNSTKGGVDTVDKMLSSYSCKRKNNRWTMAVFSNIIDVSALNAFIIYNEVDTNWKTTQKHTKRKCFLHELAISLAKPYMEKRKNLPRSEFSLMIYSKLSNQNFNESNYSEAGPSKKRKVDDSAKKKRARCQKCYISGENKNKWTSYFCCLCKKPCCNEKHSKSICADCISSP